MSLRIVDDPFESREPELAEIVQLYRPKGRFIVITCDCPRTVRPDGSIIVWHKPSCDEVTLAHIL